MKISESEYALLVVEHFENLGYDVYKEVGFGGGGFRADIYCKKSNETIVIEVKSSLNLKVIDQAYRWREHSNKVYIAIPYKKYRYYRIAKEICENFGIGIFCIFLNKNLIKEYVSPCINNNPKSTPPLYEQQKDSIAGTKGNFITPFKITCINLVKSVDHKGILLMDAIKQIDHHYSNDKAAVSCLTKMIKWGVIEEVEIFKEKNRNYIRLI